MVSLFSFSQEKKKTQSIMFNLCKKIFFFYPFLGFSHHSSPSNDHHLDGVLHHRKLSIHRSCGLSLLLFVDGERKDDCPNVLESSSIKPVPRKSVVTSTIEEKKKETSLDSFEGLCSFHDVLKLSSCTESLGFESSDQMEEDREVGVVDKEELRVRMSWRRRLLLERVKHRDEMKKNQIKKFPPPLSSLNQNGKPNFILKPVRKDGRLELTEVPIDRPNEILRASRQDGRLRLHLIVPAKIEHDEVEEMSEEEEVEEVIEEREMKLPLIGEGFRRCQEMGNHHRRNHYHHHHHMPIWKQHGVTTRSTVHVL